MKFLRRIMNDQGVEKKYVSAGAQFGDAVSYLYMGECVGFESMLNRWADWEQEYVDRGYRTVPVDNFVELGGYGKSIDHFLGQKLEENEEPIFHAQIYRDNYLGKITPVIDLNEMMNGNGNPQFGTYVSPSTKPSSE
jgi:hypothetical protein